MLRYLKSGILAGCFLLSVASIANSAPVHWDTGTGANNHYYESFWVGGSVSPMAWEDARDWAFDLTYTDTSGQVYTGYLATVTSSEENAFLIGVGQAGKQVDTTNYSYLIGGYQTPDGIEDNYDNDHDNDTDDNWHWVTGEAWSYTNWRNGEPNNTFRWSGVADYGLTEEYLQFFPESTSGAWNDVYTGLGQENNQVFNTLDTLYSSQGYLVEYELTGPAPVPEPATILLLGSGLAGLAFYRRKRK